MKTYRVSRGVLPLPSTISVGRPIIKAGDTFAADPKSHFVRRSLMNGDIVEVAANEKGK